MIVEKDGLYYHAAFAEDDEGTGFSLTDFDGAVYVGNYVDKSATESTDWTSYSWQVRGEVSVTDLEDDTELMESVEESELQDAMEDAEEDRDEIRADVIENDENLQATQHASDEGIGNLNELIGTNQGTNGWTASSGLTIEAVTGTIYNDTNDEVNYLKVTCNTAGSNYIYFDASKLREKLAQKLDTNAYTFSADVNMTTPFSVDVSVADLDGSNAQIEFEPITNDAVIDSDGAWIFNSSTGDVIQANDEPIPVSAQVLLFDLSNMTSGNVLMIANLKVEGGGLATPWRASLEEVKGMATEALNKATEVNQHFWHDTSGAHVTEVTQDEYEQDPTNAGGNVLITSQGLAIRNGEEELAAMTGEEIDFNINGYNMMRIYQGTSTPLVKNARYSVAKNGTLTVEIPAPPTGAQKLSYDNRNSVYNVHYNDQTASQSIYTGLDIIIQGAPIGVTISYPVWLIDDTFDDGTVAWDAVSRELTFTTGNVGMVFYVSCPDYGTSASYRLGTSLIKRYGTQGALAVEEGYYCSAYGDYSHAQNLNTVAGYEAQTTIGKYNDNQSTTAFEIGNGTASTPSNALTVDWNGELVAGANIIDGSGNVLANKIELSDLTDYVVEEGTSSNWEYRKWNSGKVEAWRTITNSAAAGSVWVSPMYYRDLTVSIPSGLFTSAPKIQCTSTHNQWWVSYANCTSATSLAYRIVKPISSSQASGVNIYLEGE